LEILSEKKIKVLHVINDFDGGGAQRLVIEIARNSSPKFEHFALCLSGPGEMSNDAVKAFREIRYVNQKKKLATLIFGIRALSNFVTDVHINVVHSHLIQSDFLSALTNTAKATVKIRTLHTSSISKHESVMTQVIWFLMRFLRGRFDALVACTDSAMKFAVETDQKSMLSRVISNGVDPRRIKTTPSKNFGGYFLVLARFHPVKDFPNLFRAFSIAVESGVSARLICAGSGVTHENLALAEQLNADENLKRVDLKGFKENVGPLLQKAKFLVISSSYGEALPMVGLEALANGVPVIATDVGDCKNLVADNLLLARPSRPESLAGSLIAANNLNQEEYTRLSNTSLQFAKTRFSLSRTVSEYEALYLELLGDQEN